MADESRGVLLDFFRLHKGALQGMFPHDRSIGDWLAAQDIREALKAERKLAEPLDGPNA